MMQPLPARPIPIVGESPAGLLMRTVEANGYSNLQSLLWAYWRIASGVGWARASFVKPDRYGEILEAFGIQLPEDSSPSFSRAGPTSESARNYDGVAIPERLFRDDGRYFCPDCLKEKAYWRKSWTLKTYAVCTLHKKILISDCQACGEQLNPARGRLKFCDCGADLSSMESQISDDSLFDWWLDSHKEERQGKVLDAALLAVEAMDEGSDTPEIGHKRLCTVKEWIANGIVDHYLLKLIETRSLEVHPRIQVLPLLRSPWPELQVFAHAILARCDVRRPKAIANTNKFLQVREGELALGVSRFQFKKFIELGLVGGQDKHNKQVSFDAVNRLLYDLQPANPCDSKVEGRKQTSSLAGMAVAIMNGERESAGFSIAYGSHTLQLVADDSATKEPHEIENWLDVHQISTVLETYPDAVRFLVRKGKLLARDRDLFGRKRLIAERKVVEAFSHEFVFAGALAKSVGLSHTNLAEKLMALGANPISGPRIDGALVYLFRRDEVNAIDVECLRSIKEYETKAGRKKGSTAKASGQKSNIKTISLSEASKVLNINIQEAAKLVSKNILKKFEAKDRKVLVTWSSVRQLKRNLARTDMISVEQAAAMFGMSPKSFQSRWINRGVLEAQDWGLWRRIDVKDIAILREIIDGRVTAEEAGKILSMHRSHLPNVERRGAINSEKIAGKQSIRLYDRADLIDLKKMTTASA